MKADTLNPSPSLLCKLSSIAVHADELTSPNGHTLDHVALRTVLDDIEVKRWIIDMVDAGLAPLKR